jgi:serine/threonine protein kinase
VLPPEEELCMYSAELYRVLMCRFAVKRTKKVFRDDGGLSPAFCERLRHQIDIYHAVGHGLSIAHLYGAYEDAEYVYSVQELCTGMHFCRLSQVACSAAG